MVIKAILEVSIRGLGVHGRTSIFPCGIFQCKKGVNREPDSPNYDMYRLALKSTSQRIYPNYCNCDTSMNAGYDNNNILTYSSTMGCIKGDSLVTVKIDGIEKTMTIKELYDLANDSATA